jgi:hypothetical protein
MAKFVQYKFRNNEQFLNIEKVELVQFNEKTVQFFMDTKSEDESYTIHEDQLIYPATIELLKCHLSNL